MGRTTHRQVRRWTRETGHHRLRTGATVNVYVDGSKIGGGGVTIPDTPVAVLLDGANKDTIVALDAAAGAGTSVAYDDAINKGYVESILTLDPAAPEGSALLFDGVFPGGTVQLTQPDVANFLKAARLPFTSVVNAKEHTTNNGSTHELLSINCGTANRGYILRLVVGATNATTFANGLVWDVIAAITHDGAVTVRNSVITKSDPGSPWAIALSVDGNNVKLNVTGALATNVAWFAGGYLTEYDGVM